jgi:hypothetical protein
MDGERFDELIKRMGTARVTRMSALRSMLGGAAVALTGAVFAAEVVDAKKKKKGNGKNRSNTSGVQATPKCWVCHVPPGNPDNAHAINVGCPATGPEGHSNHEGDCVEGEDLCHIPVKEENAYCWKGNSCTPESNPCGGRKCGAVTDRCGNSVSCGTCTSPDTCNDGKCTCVAEANPCGDRVCGTVKDRCGKTVFCGDCKDSETCDDNTGTCSCVAEKDPCGDRTCGTVKDSCGNEVSCGSCKDPQQCDEKTGTCSCTPICQDGAKYTCDDDGCGGTCVCPQGTTCGAYSRICVAVNPS